jgi:hypothetical protein
MKRIYRELLPERLWVRYDECLNRQHLGVDHTSESADSLTIQYLAARALEDEAKANKILDKLLVLHPTTSTALIRASSSITNISAQTIELPQEIDKLFEGITVFCAVWSKDPNRWQLLEDHHTNIQSQTLKKKSCLYILEAGDNPPPSIEKQINYITTVGTLSIYEAWNIAIQNILTPIAMNLNLDDRLFNNALELIYDYFNTHECDLVGGEWLISKSQELTKSYLREFDPTTKTSSIEIARSWPPITCDALLKLGSGRGDSRSTYGPATAFRINGSINFPHQFNSGEQITSVGDAIFWQAIASRGGILKRLDNFIGIYHTHPNEQAEFRPTNDHFNLKIKSMPIFTDVMTNERSAILNRNIEIFPREVSKQIAMLNYNGRKMIAFSKRLGKFISRQQLIDRLKDIKNSDTCHIVASGATATSAVRYKDSGHDFYAVNFSSILPLPYKFTFCESAAYSSPRRNDFPARCALTLAEISQLQHMKNCLICFKNLWHGHVDPEFVNDHYNSNDWVCIADVLLPNLTSLTSRFDLSTIAHTALNQTSEIFTQVHTTTLSALFSACWVGYKNIILHGFDGSGPHFYADNISNLLGYCQTSLRLAARSRDMAINTDGPHPVGSPAQQLMPFFEHIMRDQGVRLYTGSIKSPLARRVPHIFE